MVKRPLYFKNRNAFTMIELIFAIVVIAISIISLPRMIQATSEGITANIIQEGIFATGALLTESTTYYWDANSLNDAATSLESKVVNTGDCIVGGPPFRRIGHINRSCLNSNTTAVNTVGDSSSIEAAAVNYTNTKIFEGAGPAAATYKDNYIVDVNVTYCGSGGCVKFGNVNNNPNLKEIEITIRKKDSANNVVILRAYTANIGEAIPKKETF